MKKILTKSLAILLSMLMCLTLAPFVLAEGEEAEITTAPVFKIELESETDKEAVVTITLTENEFKCLDFTLFGNENLKIVAIALNPEISLNDDSDGSASSNIINGRISFARTTAFVPVFKVATYTFEKLSPTGVKAADFTAEITSCGLESKVDITDIAVIDMAIPAEHTHTPVDEWIETEASTCAKTGIEVRYCGICGEVADTRDTAKKEHGETRTEHKDSTCTEAGYTKVVCVVCGEATNEIPIPASHGATDTEHVDPTCTEAGYDRVFCTVCKEILDTTTIPATNHSERETVTVPPTCTESGYDRIICKTCGETIDETPIPATNHANKENAHLDPTCTEAGYDRTVCKDCGTITSEASIPATNHPEKETVHLDPTCTEAGYDKTICKDCGTITSETSLPATGHSKETTVDRKLPTCTEDGYIKDICNVCKGIANERTIPATGHGYIQDIQLPTCTEDGHSREYCPSCEDSRYEITLNKTGHSWLGWKVVTPPTYAKPGVERKVCNNCGADEERSIPALVAKPTEIVLNMQEAGMNFRQTMRLFANVYPDEASYSTEIIWESSDESVVTVNEDGEVYATGLGTATVTAKTADGSVSTTCEITVKYSTLQWIIVYILFGWIWYL